MTETQQVNNNGIIDFENLPRPTVIEDITYEQILQEMKAEFIRLNPDYPPLLESDPILKTIESYAYRELLLRSRINSAAQANMLPLATNSDLDMIGAFYNVARNVVQEEDRTTTPIKPKIMETDESYRSRIRDRIAGWSTAGGAYHYRYWARENIGKVHDVSVSSPVGGEVLIAVMSTDNNGVPDQDLIDQVTAQVSRDDIRVLTDTVRVVGGSPVYADVVADITLLPDSPTRVYDELVSNFATSFNSLRRLGRDVTRSWLIDQLFVDGVYGVELPTPVQDIIVSPTEFPVLRSVTLRLAGRKE